MQKPTLEQYNLTTNELNEYEKQKQRYKEKKDSSEFECKEYNKKVKIGVVIAVVIIYTVIFMLCFSFANNDFGAGLIITLLVLAVPMVISIICGLFFDKDFENSWFTYILSVLFLPCLGLGFVLYNCFARVEEVDKYNYIDKVIENKVVQYDEKLAEYEEYKKQVSLRYWQNMTGYQFENAVANLYRKMGCEAEVTPGSGDGGVDIILKKDGLKIAVQCKHHMSLVGPNDFRALVGVVAVKGYDSGIFVSLSGFTKGVLQEQKNSKIRVELLDVHDLIKLSKETFDNVQYEEKDHKKNVVETQPKKVYIDTTDKPLKIDNSIANIDLKGAIIYYEKYGSGWIKSIIDDKLIIKFAKETDSRVFLKKSLGTHLRILCIDDVDSERIEEINRYYAKLNDIEGKTKNMTMSQLLIRSERGSYRGKIGFQAYNYKGQNIGLIFMTDDPRTPAYENIELCVYAQYKSQYGEWKRIKSRGGRIKWSYFCQLMERNEEYIIEVDNL